MPCVVFGLFLAAGWLFVCKLGLVVWMLALITLAFGLMLLCCVYFDLLELIIVVW